MNALTCFITDDRHAVQTLALLVGADAAYARRLAIDDLKTNSHHQAVEAWAGEQRLFVLTRDDLEAMEIVGCG
jgi:hypothetical protein